MSAESRLVGRVYVETSVWGVFLPGQPAAMRRVSARLLKETSTGQACISAVVLREIEDAAGPARRRMESEIARIAPVILEVNEACQVLAQAYLDAGILPAKKLKDAFHVAIATVHQIDLLASWNYRHLASPRKNQLYQVENAKQGYERTPRILTPYEVLYGQKS